MSSGVIATAFLRRIDGLRAAGAFVAFGSEASKAVDELLHELGFAVYCGVPVSITRGSIQLGGAYARLGMRALELAVVTLRDGEIFRDLHLREAPGDAARLEDGTASLANRACFR